MTSTDHPTHPTPVPADAAIYRSDGLGLHLAFAAVYGEREGIIAPGALPERIDSFAAQRQAYRVLEESGALTAYREHLRATAQPALCPAWCHGRHPSYVDDIGFVEHAMPVAERFVDVGEQLPATVTVAVRAVQADDDVDAACITVRVDPERSMSDAVFDLATPEAARELAEALCAGAAALEEVTTPGSGPAGA